MAKGGQEKPKKMSLTSMDVAQEKREQLKRLFPEVFSEDQVNFDAFRRVLGTWVEPTQERFGLNWHGKAETMKVIQQPSIATLKPAREQSVDFDETHNLFIEGDNLEVLKLLQKSYFGKVKMIYIDPPYNTGKEFIYPDNYKEELQTYLHYTRQIDDNGYRFSTNTEREGRFHSNWLTMMYPRLYIAKNLLREDGVIFISIDDNEQANLKKLCDMIFGEENLDCFVWHKAGDGRYGKMKNTETFRKDHEYVLVAYKSIQKLNKLWDYPQFQNQYENPDNDPRGAYKAGSISLKEDASNRKHRNYYTVTSPGGNKFSRQFDVAEGEFEKLNEDGRIYWGRNQNSVPALKIFINERRFSTPSSLIRKGSTYEGTEELESILSSVGAKSIRPKPSSLLFLLTQIATNESDIVLDFFAGSCTTAHAVMQLNAEDGGNRQFIMVQLPEPCDEKSEAHKAGYRTIADIGRERIRRAAKKIKADNPEYQGDVGFKSFTLAPSNFKVWESDVKNITDLEQQLLDHIDHVDPASSPEDILYELLLNAGFPLTAKTEKIIMAQKEVYSINNGTLLICLDKDITNALIDAMAAANPQQVICLDKGFNGNDQLKVNAVQTFKSRAQQNESEIVFRTV